MSMKAINRRKFVAGAAGLSAAAATSALFAASPATAATGKSVIALNGTSNGTIDLAKYHCSLVHKAMSEKLTRTVADPNISAAETARALRTTFCPCCNTQINAAYQVVLWSEIGKAYG